MEGISMSSRLSILEESIMITGPSKQSLLRPPFTPDHQFCTTQELEEFSSVSLSSAFDNFPQVPSKPVLLEESSMNAGPSSPSFRRSPFTSISQFCTPQQLEELSAINLSTAFDNFSQDCDGSHLHLQSEANDSFFSTTDKIRAITDHEVDTCTPPRRHHEYRQNQIANNRDSRIFDDEYQENFAAQSIGLPLQVNTYARKTHIGPWQLGKTLGTGSTGRIRLVRHESSGQRGAAKIMTKEYNLETYLENGRELAQERWTNAMEREVIIMKMIRHPHVVQMYDVWETKRELYLVLEYVEGGDLFEYIIKHQQVAEAEAVRLFVQLMSGVDYCHSFSICHRDLKPENILLDKFNNVKIADFGFAALQPPGWKLARSCGTPHYAAPEVIAGVQYDGAPADIWSCGVILFALLAGRVPFDDEDARVLLQKVRFGAFDMPEELSPEAKDLISRMLTVEPTSRITMAEIWTHPLFSNYLSPAKLEEARLPHGYSNVGRPLANANEIDPVILESLRSLWHGQSAAVVTEALMNEELNQEKIFYALLQKYRDDHLEHYTGKLSTRSPDEEAYGRWGSRARAAHGGGAITGKLGRTQFGRSNSSAKFKKANTLGGKISKKERPTSCYDIFQTQSPSSQNSTAEKGKGLERATFTKADAWDDLSDGLSVSRSIRNNVKRNHIYQQGSPVKSLKILSTPHKRGVIFRHAGSRLPIHQSLVVPGTPGRLEAGQPEQDASGPYQHAKTAQPIGLAFNSDLAKGDWVDIKNPMDTTLDHVDKFLPVMSKKEGQAKKANRLSMTSVRTLEGTGTARIITNEFKAPIRRRVKKNPEDLNEEVRKVSKDFGEYCEAIFRLRSARYSSAVLNDTVAELELSTFSMDFSVNVPMRFSGRETYLAGPWANLPMSTQSSASSLIGLEDQKYLAGYIIESDEYKPATARTRNGDDKETDHARPRDSYSPLQVLKGFENEVYGESLPGSSQKKKHRRKEPLSDLSIYVDLPEIQPLRFNNDMPLPATNRDTRGSSGSRPRDSTYQEKGKKRADLGSNMQPATPNNGDAIKIVESVPTLSREEYFQYTQPIRDRKRTALGETDGNSQKQPKTMQPGLENASPQLNHSKSQSIKTNPAVVRKPAPPVHLQAQVFAKKPSGRTISMRSLKDICGPVPVHPGLTSPEPVHNRSAPILTNYRQLDQANQEQKTLPGQYASRHWQPQNSVNVLEEYRSQNQVDDRGSLNVPKKRTLLSKIGGLLSGGENSDTQPAQEKRFWSGSSTAVGSGTRNFSGGSKESTGSTGSKFMGLWGRNKKEGINVPEARAPMPELNTSSYWREHDEPDNTFEPVQYAKPGWLQRVLKITPATHMICFRLNAIATRRELLRILAQWNYGGRGIVDLRDNRRQGTITGKVSKRNPLHLSPVSFVIEVRSFGANRHVPRAVAKVTQLKGAASSLKRFVEELRNVSRSGGILIEEPTQMREMEMIFRPIRLY